jgi:hypothetical protein
MKDDVTNEVVVDEDGNVIETAMSELNLSLILKFLKMMELSRMTEEDDEGG